LSEHSYRRTDQELMQDYCNDQAGAFQEIYQRHQAKVYGYLSKRLKADHVDEVFQNVFLKFHKKRQSYDPKFDLAAWLYTITKSTLIDFIRKKERYTQLLQEIIIEESAQKDQIVPESHKNAFEWKNHLKGKSLDAIQLRYEQGLEFDEMAQALKTSPSNVRKIISRSLLKLRQVLREEQK